MGSSDLLDLTVHLVRLLLSICMPCVISALEKLFKGLGNLFVLYRSLFLPLYPLLGWDLHTAGYQENATSTLSKLYESVRVIHVVLTTYTYGLSQSPPQSSFRFSAALYNASRMWISMSPNTAIRDATRSLQLDQVSTQRECSSEFTCARSCAEGRPESS